MKASDFSAISGVSTATAIESLARSIETQDGPRLEIRAQSGPRERLAVSPFRPLRAAIRREQLRRLASGG